MASKIQMDINRHLNRLQSFGSSTAKFHQDTIDKIEKGLRNTFLKFRTEKDSKITHSLEKLVNSSDIDEKLCGAIGIMSYSKILNENEILSFVNKFLNIIYNNILMQTDDGVITVLVKVYSVLVELGGINIAHHIQENVKSCMINLHKPEKRHTLLLILVQLLRHAQFITFNRIRRFEYVVTFKLIMSDKRPMTRAAGLEFIDECIKETSKRDKNEQVQSLTKIFIEIFKEKNTRNLESDTNWAILNVLKSLLTHSSPEVFEDRFIEIAEFVMHFCNSRNQYFLKFFETSYLKLTNLIKENFKNQKSIDSNKNNLYFTIFDSLSNLMEPYSTEHVKPYAQSVLKLIFEKLALLNHRKITSIIPCIQSLALKIRTSFTKIFNLMEIQEIIDLLLLNGVTRASLQFFEFLESLQIEDLSNIIQLKMLLSISCVLNKGSFFKFNAPQHIVTKHKSTIVSFRLKLRSQHKDWKPMESNICMNLTCLSKYDFKDYRCQIEVVLQYLDDPKSSVRKDAAKVVSLLQPRGIDSADYEQTVSRQSMTQILNKLLAIAISDPDIKVRGIMLNSLKNNFNSYLKKKSNLQRLILSLNDSSEEVQQKTIVILKNLIPNNPSEIVPALQKVLFKLVRVINLDSIDTHKGILKNLKLLRCYIKHASFLLNDQEELIFGFLLSIIRNQNTTPLITAEVFSTLRAVTSISQKVSIKYFDELMKILMQNLQDMAFKKKRIEAIKCMTALICTSGLVVYANYRYPKLNELLFLLFQLEPHSEARVELMRLMGHIGAIDYFNLFRIKNSTQSKQLQVGQSELINIMQTSHKSKFCFEKYLQFQNDASNKGANQLSKFFENVVNLNQIVSNNYEEKDSNLPVFGTFESQKKQSDKQYLLDQESDILDADIKELLQYPNFINLSNIETLLEYITDVTVKALLLKLFDETLLVNSHVQIISALYSIVYGIEEGISPYLHIIVPCLSKYFFKNYNKERTTVKILELFESILRKCGSRFGNSSHNNINLLLGIILKTLNNVSQRDVMMKVLDTMIELIESNKSMLKYKTEKVALKLLNLILSGTEQKEAVQKIFKILKSLREFNENFLHLVLPSFCTYMNENYSSNYDFSREIIKYIEAMIDQVPITQYSSLIIHTLLDTFEKSKLLREDCKNCLISIVLRLKNNVLFYMPLINQSFKNHGFEKDPEFIKIIDNLKAYGNLENIENFRDRMPAHLLGSAAKMNNTMSSGNLNFDESNRSREFVPNAIRQFSSEKIRALFDVSNNSIKEDWEEWITKTQNELLILSPSTVLYSCRNFAKINPSISRELFNVAFAIIWSQFNDNQKTFVIQNIEKTIISNNVPLTVLKLILNLAEFMEHDSQGLQLDISCMADLAEKVNVHAKALYYREFEFYYCPESTIDSLLSLYSSLGQPEAADGMLIFAKRMLKTQVKSSWLESLGRWKESLEEYTRVEKAGGLTNDLKAKRIKCHSKLGNWEVIVEQAEKELSEGYRITSFAHHAAKAAMHLGQWEQVEVYAESIDPKKEDPNFYHSLVSINKEKFDLADTFIGKCRKQIENLLVGVNSSNYHNSYEHFVRLMMLSEMEEIIFYKTSEQDMEKSQKFDHFRLQSSGQESKISKRKQKLQELWSDRLEGVEKEMHTWMDILGVRSLLFSKSEMMPLLLRFSKWSIKKQWPSVCQRIFQDLELDLNRSIVEDLQKQAASVQESSPSRLQEGELLTDPGYPFPPIYYLSYYEYQYQLKEVGIEEVYNNIQTFFQRVECSPQLMATYNRKLGSWMSEDETTSINYGQITDIFKSSLEFDSSVVKTWHLYALANYKRVKEITDISLEKNRRATFEEVIEENSTREYITDAFKGFIKSISLGGPGCSETLQDTLRLLDLWFQYGEHRGMQTIIQELFRDINLECFLTVIPQMISKLNTKQKTIRNNIEDLLELIGRQYPQGIIFQLFVTLHKTTSLSKKGAGKIIKKLEVEHPLIVKQSQIVSKELNKAAILFEEEWYDMIDTILGAFVKKDYDMVYKVMSKMHQKLRTKEPESQNEVWFFQKYEHLMLKAEFFIKKYNQLKDPLPMYQALELYYRMMEMMKNSIKGMVRIHLKNVSPKLMMLKNTHVCVPGLFHPRRENTYIQGFNGVLRLIRSKRRPRILRLKGSDGKAYDFLLKGGEDMRQDERVMQLLTLANTLLSKDNVTEKKDLTIVTFPVIPLSMQSGLLGWVRNTDTLHQLIKDHREQNFFVVEAERSMQRQLCENYQDLPITNKVEIFRYIMENSKGEDIQKVLWLKSQNAEEWLRKRTNFTRSLATMSMVGYILGLGDRHLSNLMMQRYSGKMVHIDFGDCFEVAMLRDKYPEKVPFRLTRVLVNAMEASGIEGNYRFTCESVLRVIRENRESLIAILEAFVRDPLMNQRWLLGDQGNTESKSQPKKKNSNNKSKPTAEVQHEIEINPTLQSISINQANALQTEDSYVGDSRLDKMFRQLFGKNDLAEITFDRKALEAMNRIKAKLTGKDFNNSEPLSTKYQVEKLIRQATSHENICQGFIGWNPFL